MISYDLLSRVGCRDNNEDNVGMFQAGEEYCFALADGLGGHGKGEVASGIAVEQAVAAFAQAGEASEAVIHTAFQNGQEAILEAQKADLSDRDMKTTFVYLLVGKEEIRWAHIGDSRLYRFEHGKLAERTLDHSVPQMLVAAGQIKEKQIRHHPDRNRLLRVMGTDWEEPRYQLGGPVPATPGQAFLLCTDGFWEWIEEKKMISALKKSRTPREWLQRMEEIVLKQGRGENMDNYSAIAVWTE